MWTTDLVLLACTVFLFNFGEGSLLGVRTNFFVDDIGMTGAQVLWLEGIREIPGLALMFVAALIMHLPLARRAAVSLLLLGVGYALYSVVHSYTALLAIAVTASLGMHSWMPLRSALGMSLAPKEKSGRVLGALSSAASLASIIGMGAIALASGIMQTLSLRLLYIIGGALIILAGLLLLKLPSTIGATQAKQPRMLLKRRYWLYYVLSFFAGSRKEVLGTFGSLVLVQVYDFEVWQLSTLLLIGSVLRFLCAPLLGALIDRYGERTMVSSSYAALILCCIGFATIQQVWLLSALLLVIKLLVMLGMGLSTYVNRIAPAEELTPTLSAGISINHVTSVAMPMVAGLLLPVIGYSGVFLMTAGLVAISIPFALALRTEVKPASAE